MPIGPSPQTRVCAKCDQAKPIECFAVHRSTRSGRLSTCGDCRRADANERKRATRHRAVDGRKLGETRTAKERSDQIQDDAIAEILRSHRDEASRRVG